jgi:hypothetical protein
MQRVPSITSGCLFDMKLIERSACCPASRLRPRRRCTRVVAKHADGPRGRVCAHGPERSAMVGLRHRGHLKVRSSMPIPWNAKVRTR